MEEKQTPLRQVQESQPMQQAAPSLKSQIKQLVAQKPSKWGYFFITLAILQAVGIAAIFLIMIWAVGQAEAGVSGTEFIGLAVFVTLVPVVGIVAFINLVALLIYMAKGKLHGKLLVLGIASLVLLITPVMYGAYSVYQIRVIEPKQEKEFAEQSRKELEQGRRQFVADNVKPEITKEEAVALLKTCKLKGFYYTDQTSKDNGNWGELSSTGVVLTKLNGRPYRISIADRLVPELVPIARDAQQTCGSLQFWHDGRYEQHQADGTWR